MNHQKDKLQSQFEGEEQNLFIGKVFNKAKCNLTHIKNIFNNMNLYCKYFRDWFVTAKYFRGKSPDHC